MGEVFTITPASTRPIWFLVSIGSLLLALMLSFGLFMYASRATIFELVPDGLRISRTPYGRTIPWSSIDASGARAINLAIDSTYRPSLRTNGMSVPGYQVGWYRLGGSGKGLLFVTEPESVAAIPVKEGYTLLVSVEDAEEFIEAVRRRAG